MLVMAGGRSAPGGGSDKKVGFIDESGRVVVEPRYDSARDFSEGLAFAWGGGFLGFIDRDGKEVFKINNLAVGDFHDGLASIELRAAWPPEGGYIDRSGRLAIKGRYAFVDDFRSMLPLIPHCGGASSAGRWSGEYTVSVPGRHRSRVGLRKELACDFSHTPTRKRSRRPARPRKRFSAGVRCSPA